jgi:uncharacterized protein (TIGR02300 family)
MEAASASQANKAARGTKRLCEACQVRFYDLWRDPIVCPACGAQHTPVVQQAVEVGRRGVSGEKASFRQSIKRPAPVPAEPALGGDIRPEAAADEGLEVAAEDATETGSDEDIVLEHEPDDGDVSGLMDVDVEEQER